MSVLRRQESVRRHAAEDVSRVVSSRRAVWLARLVFFLTALPMQLLCVWSPFVFLVLLILQLDEVSTDSSLRIITTYRGCCILRAVTGLVVSSTLYVVAVWVVLTRKSTCRGTACSHPCLAYSRCSRCVLACAGSPCKCRRPCARL